jgi:pyrroloquinoline-quinone synthase
VRAGGAPPAPAELERRLRRIGAERYHHRHPFNVRMHEGRLSPEELRGWVRNRYYYQTRIPVKDGMILAKSSEATFRREWIQRIRDHDGERAGEGGLELWLRLAEAVGLERAAVERCERVLPGVRRACDAYVEFVAGHDLLESVASSLTELFAGDIMRVRIAAFEEHYPWVDADGLRYFRTRTVQAPRDAGYGLAFVLEHARTREDQQRAERALLRKCEILWSLLDAVADAFRRPRLAPGALLRQDAADGPQVVLPERLVRLDESARAILALCQGTRSAEEIALELRERGGGEPAIEADVHEFLGAMRRLGVLAD